MPESLALDGGEERLGPLDESQVAIGIAGVSGQQKIGLDADVGGEEDGLAPVRKGEPLDEHEEIDIELSPPCSPRAQEP